MSLLPRAARLLTLLAAGLLLVSPGLLQAGLTVVDGDGYVVSVEIVSDPSNPQLQGLGIVQHEAGGVVTFTVESTLDPAVDRGPQISLNPVDGQPVIVWSRHDGTDFELAMMRRLPDRSWAPFDLLTSNDGNDVEARMIVDDQDVAHLLWWPEGEGGPVALQSFDVRTAAPVGAPRRPFEPSPTRKLRFSETTGESDIGGGDDPGTVGNLTSRASAVECADNPEARPEHGPLLSCGRPAAYQVTSCLLVVGTWDTVQSTWIQTTQDLSATPLTGIAVRDLAQAIADARCR